MYLKNSRFGLNERGDMLLRVVDIFDELFHLREIAQRHDFDIILNERRAVRMDLKLIRITSLSIWLLK